jgi:probable F420-dependent oxidoreductase
MTRPFHFGLQAARIHDPVEWRAMARRTEADGYTSLLIPDHVGRLSPFPALMSAASVTSTITLATYVLNQDFRPPAVLAQEAAAVHALTDGRLVLGLGAGWAKQEYAQTGIQFDDAATRVARFDEYVQVVKGLLNADGPFSFDGRWFQLDSYPTLPRPASMEPSKILIGGGSKHVLEIAGRLADIVSVATRATPEGQIDATNMTRRAVERKLGWIREAAGDRFDDVEMNVTIREVRVTTDREAAAREILAGWTAPGSRMGRADELSADDVLASPYLCIGTIDQIVAQLEADRTSLGFSYIEVDGKDVESFAPVMERLTSQQATLAGSGH